VLSVDNHFYVKTGNGLYKLDGDKWKRLPIEFSKTFVFYENGWVEEDYLPERNMFQPDDMSRLIPQPSLMGATKAEVGDRLFVSVGGSLFEYHIRRHYQLTYGDRSIRNIFLEPGLKMVSTYSGIFINDTIRAIEPSYANGYFSRIGDRLFLSSDHLYEYVPPGSFREIEGGHNQFSGYSRKLVEFGGGVYSLNTKSVNRFDKLRELEPIHQGFEYLDLEVAGGRLLFCTQSGEIFAYDGKAVSRVCRLNSRIRDLYVFRNTVYVSSDQGVFTFNGKDSASIQQIAQTPFSVMTIVDPQRNTWIATENGLFVLPDRKTEPIPFIPDVEFNRGALLLDGDDIHAGSISGIYTFNSLNVMKNFLSLYFNKKTQDESRRRRGLLFWVLACTVLVGAAGTGYRAYRKRNSKLVIPQKETAKALTIKQVAEDIRRHGIMTVEALAEHYQTNTVQLNRQFKAFSTTPGRFMKKVKMDYAKELLEQNIPMEEVASKVGYSALFIRKELQSLS
jgi:AraC-like DNA-binding protein